jgi:UDP-glucose 4-epimerase
LAFASTGGAVYGDFAVPPNGEQTPKDPESPYAVSKLSVEHYLAYYGRVHGMDTVALRYANVYGPRQDPHGEAGVVAIFCGRVLAGEAIRIFGDGTQTRDYVYVGDVAEATFRAATSALPAPGQLNDRAFNVGTGVETSVLRLASVLQDVAGRTVPTEFAPHRPGEQQRSALDVRKIMQVLGWTPHTSLEEGLMHTYRWFAARSSRPSTPAPT